MNRRDFLKYGSAGLTLPFWLQSCNLKDQGYPIRVNSDHHTGHLIRESINWPIKKKDRIEIAIVGGGISGLTAAFKLKDTNFQLFELSDRLGGTVSVEEYNGIRFSQGAHYDLAYPENYGPEVLDLMKELNIIRYEPWKKSWSFIDSQHLIPYYRKQQCYENGTIRKDVIPESPVKDQFIELMLSYSRKMNLPTRLIDPDLRHLDKISFADFITDNMSHNETLKRQLDYHMYDDYGGSCDMVSATAGILYFACRPYYTDSVDLFSPPNGNDYFAQKMINYIDPQRLNTRHLVKSIEKMGDTYVLHVIDVLKQVVLELVAEKVIYAGQKHALKYIYPDQAGLFNNNSYAPWMVVNMITRQKKGDYGFWQNEYLGENPKFLGFINSSVQAQIDLNGYQVLTGYYCLDESDRAYLTTIEKHKAQVARETQEYMENMLDKSLAPEACFIKVMGHAMPVPKPGYLFNDANDSPQAKMIYAGVDNGRLPLLYEALDSGIMASKLI